MAFPVPIGERAWFALTVLPRHERAIARMLATRAVEYFVAWHPARRRWSDRLKVIEENLLNGYVFARFGYEHRLKVLSIPGVMSIVSVGRCPAVIPDAEISALRLALASGLPMGAWPYIKVGQRVRIEEGALAGLEGTLARDPGGWRVVITVEMLQRSLAVEVDREILRPAA